MQEVWGWVWDRVTSRGLWLSGAAAQPLVSSSRIPLGLPEPRSASPPLCPAGGGSGGARGALGIAPSLPGNGARFSRGKTPRKPGTKAGNGEKEGQGCGSAPSGDGDGSGGSSGEGTRDGRDGEGALGSAGVGMLLDAAPSAPPLVRGERRPGRKRRMLRDGICQNGGGEAGTLLLRISPGWRGCENAAFPEVTAGKG